MERSDLVRALEGIQRASGWSDARLAARLGVTRGYWSLVRRGLRRPGVKLLRGVAASFPELREAAVYFLARDVGDVGNAQVTERSSAGTGAGAALAAHTRER